MLWIHHNMETRENRNDRPDLLLCVTQYYILFLLIMLYTIYYIYIISLIEDYKELNTQLAKVYSYIFDRVGLKYKRLSPEAQQSFL